MIFSTLPSLILVPMICLLWLMISIRRSHSSISLPSWRDAFTCGGDIDRLMTQSPSLGPGLHKALLWCHGLCCIFFFAYFLIVPGTKTLREADTTENKKKWRQTLLHFVVFFTGWLYALVKCKQTVHLHCELFPTNINRYRLSVLCFRIPRAHYVDLNELSELEEKHHLSLDLFFSRWFCLHRELWHINVFLWEVDYITNDNMENINMSVVQLSAFPTQINPNTLSTKKFCRIKSWWKN